MILHKYETENAYIGICVSKDAKRCCERTKTDIWRVPEKNVRKSAKE